MRKQPLSPQAVQEFADAVARWQKQHGRHHLPWQSTRDPYRIWISEIMLQQTQVKTVLEYYPRFLARFPTIEVLADTPLEELMPYWAGLGYYARARNLHRTAELIVEKHHGQFPRSQSQLVELPGIGPSTAAAIAAFAFNERVSILDGNVKRVLARFAGIHEPLQSSATERAMWALAQHLVQAAPEHLDMTAYTQGLMDLGALLCTRTEPICQQCPLHQYCYAQQHQLWEQLPVRPPARRLTNRRKHMLIWQQADHLLLEERAQEGIWGGLLSLPEFRQKAQLHKFCRTHGQFGISQTQELTPITHRFTHFILHIQPWQAQFTDSELPTLALPEYRWVPLEALPNTALPAPIKRLLLPL